MATINSPKEEFARHCAELLGPLGAVRSRRMFGGHGFYVDGIFMALIVAERLYLKVDELSRARFDEAGCEPFVYEGGHGKQVSLNYCTAPDEAMESPGLMLPWARLAMEAGLRAAAAKARVPVRPRAAPAKKTRPAAKRSAR